jgi:hypothetical protein
VRFRSESHAKAIKQFDTLKVGGRGIPMKIEEIEASHLLAGLRFARVHPSGSRETISSIGQKVREKIRIFSLPELNEVSLELKPQSESHVERKIEQRGLQEVRIRLAQSAFGILVLQSNRLRVEDVEEVGNEAKLHPLVDVIRIIGVEIEPDIRRGSSLGAPTSNRHFTGVPIDGMGQQLADWHAGLKVHRWSNSEATKSATERTELLFSELIAGEDINYMPAISVEWSNLELISKQVEVTGSEIE